jgi:hypothetical protein
MGYSRNPCFYFRLGTFSGDNQTNTCAQLRVLKNADSAVISSWDESTRISIDSVSLTSSVIEFSWEMAILETLQTIQKEQSLVRSQSVVARVVAGETLIVPIRAKVGDLASIYSFNGTGSLIWKCLQSPRTVTELAAAVSKEYDVELTQAERDVTDFVNELTAVGLVEVPVPVAMAGD